MTWPPAGHDRSRELFSDDAEPCEPVEPTAADPGARCIECDAYVPYDAKDAGAEWTPDGVRCVDCAVPATR